MKKFTLIILITIMITSSCKKDEDDKIVYQTNFSNENKWYSGVDINWSCGVNQDKYEMLVNSPGYYAWAIAPYSHITFDYSVSVDCSLILEDKNKSGVIGIYYNYFDMNHNTAFLMNNNGFFQVIKNENQIYKILIQSTLDTTILNNASQINRLEVIQRSTSTEFKVNNTIVGMLSYGRNSPDVKAGLIAMSGIEPYFTKIKAVFDNFVIKKI